MLHRYLNEKTIPRWPNTIARMAVFPFAFRVVEVLLLGSNWTISRCSSQTIIIRDPGATLVLFRSSWTIIVFHHYQKFLGSRHLLYSKINAPPISFSKKRSCLGNVFISKWKALVESVLCWWYHLLTDNIIPLLLDIGCLFTICSWIFRFFSFLWTRAWTCFHSRKKRELELCFLGWRAIIRENESFFFFFFFFRYHRHIYQKQQ